MRRSGPILVDPPTSESTRAYRVVATLSRPLVRALFRPEVNGLEHLPESGFVLSSNQLSNLDGFALAYLLYPRQLWWMAKAELFNPVFGRFLRALRLFPVRRGEGDMAAIQTAVELARGGYVVGIFPEGTRRSKGLRKKHEARPHTGAARVALAAGVPLVPAAIIGTERLMALRRWRISFGSPIPHADLEGPNRLAAREATKRLWAEITALESKLRAEGMRPPRRLRPRLIPDISTPDLFFGLRACRRASRGETEKQALAAWDGGQEGLACLSVRSGFDLLLQALQLEPGDEVAVSAITHPDMVRILDSHGLRALPVDLDPNTLTPRPELLERVIGPRARAILVAHLFGSRADLDPIAQIARRHGVLLVEDCAQSFRGPEDVGSPLADVSLFSFGSIKTATALGGALVSVREPELLQRMRSLQEAQPIQPRHEYAARLLKYMALLQLAKPRAYWVLARGLGIAGKDLDFLNGVVRGFPGPDLLSKIRRRPSAPLLALLERRLKQFDRGRVQRREQLGEYLTERLPESIFHPGVEASNRTHWVYPVVVSDRVEVVRSLREAGFDAATATSSLAPVDPPADRPDLQPEVAREIMSGVVYLPLYPELEDLEVEKLLHVLSETDSRDG